MTFTAPRTQEPHTQVRENPERSEPVSGGPLWSSQRKGASLAAVAIIVGLLVGFLAASLVSARTPIYSSKAVLLMDQPGAISLSDGDGVILKLSRLRLKYAGLVGTQTINASVGIALHEPAAGLAGLVTASAPGSNLNIDIVSATAKKADAVTLASSTATTLQHYINAEQLRAKVAPNLRLQLTLIQPATAVAASGKGDHRQAVVGIAAAVLAAAAVAAAGLLRR